MAEKQDNALSAGKGPDWWVKEIGRSWKDWATARERGEKVIERFRDEREQVDAHTKRFNIFFSNVETLKPAVYSQVPVPDIRRRWQDKDPVGRTAATVLQRATKYCIESYDFHSVLKRVRDDVLLPGFAVARAVYKPHLKKEEMKGEDGKPVTSERVVYQEVACEYVPWDMFAMSRAKIYERVWWAGTAEDLTRDEVKLQFGPDVAAKLNYGLKAGDEDAPEGKVRLWEIWCKRGRSRFVLAEGFDGWVKPPEADPLRLENFFPWPKPLWAITTNDSMAPLPEFLQYQDQADELDDLTDRIDVLTSALRRRGVYAASDKETLEGLADSTADNTFKPIENWTALVEKGGLQNLIMEMPLDNLAKVILTLEDRRDRVKQTIYEVTGIADIVRGASNASETATAQQIKGQWAGLRISARQSDFAVFARDLVRLQAEIIAERFDPQTLSLISGIRLPMAAEKAQWQQVQAQQQQAMQQWQQFAQQAQQAGQPIPPKPPVQPPTPDEQRFYAQPAWEEVIKVLRDDKLRGFKIDIETDSTVQPDADTEKKARTEFLLAIGQSSQQLAAGVQSGIITQEFAKEAFAFTMRAFKAGSSMEEALDAMQAPQSMSPGQAQQMQKQLQEQQQALAKQGQEVAKREQAAKEAESQAALKAKDIQNASDKLQAERDLFDLEKELRGQIQQMHQAHAQQIDALGGAAEGTLREIIQNLPQPGMTEAAENAAGVP